MYLLDTNVISWIETVDDADLYLSAVTLGEIQAGIEMTREQNACASCRLISTSAPSPPCS